MNSTPRLFTPIRLRELELPNRLWVSPMCQYSAVDGKPQPWHLVHLGSFAVGRAGLVIAEATAVSPEGRISPADAGIWSDEQAELWRPVVDFVHGQDTRIALQLAHAGRKASTRPPQRGRGYAPPEEGGWRTVAPSPIAFGSLPTPRELSRDEIAGVVADFAAAARRAIRAGFDAVEVHAAHGYLLHEFLSPLANHRADDYGGDFAGRTRLVLEVTRAVREAIGASVPLLVRISATDWCEGGWDLDQSVALAPLLAEAGADLIDVSSGGLLQEQKIHVGPGYQAPLARAVRAAGPLPVFTVGLITNALQAESLLIDEAADVIMAGREFLRDSNFALRAAAELGAPLEWPEQYRMARFPGSIP
jgi:2,4-dienoyl-CoA reductase-like NADH-dependent reductase (Old Yellow Enzyme family)